MYSGFARGFSHKPRALGAHVYTIRVYTGRERERNRSSLLFCPCVGDDYSRSRAPQSYHTGGGAHGMRGEHGEWWNKKKKKNSTSGNAKKRKPSLYDRDEREGGGVKNPFVRKMKPSAHGVHAYKRIGCPPARILAAGRCGNVETRAVAFSEIDRPRMSADWRTH